MAKKNKKAMTEGNMEISSEQLQELAKAIWEAAYGIGRCEGEDEAISAERGMRHKAKTAQQAWESEVGWQLKADATKPFDMADPECWHRIW